MASTGGDSCTVVVVVGGSCSATAPSDGCTMMVVVGGSCSAPALTDGCTTTAGGGGSVTAAGAGSFPFLLAGAGSFPFLLAGAGSFPFLLAGAGSFPFSICGLESFPRRVGADATGPVDCLAEVLGWVLDTLVIHAGWGVGKRSMVERKSFLRTIGREEGEVMGVEDEGVVVGGVCLLDLGAGAWVVCCCEVDGCWVSECMCLCTVGERGQTVGEDTGDVCMDVVEVSASEVCVLLGVVMMLVVDGDAVHAGVGVEVTGWEVEEQEEGETVEIVDVVVSATEWCGACVCL
ncbi:hypothetical protein NDU88_006936 [Pleurodeles waltl]|uniref:Uncharacterized protein n=1 Tax=Pleurodeles waltl TaxID=8319 RepID=A0AAV7TZZ8_PLEWA|nr:hypothetical protein NDU88_006936 [Pleurodeles waltl]